MSYTIGDAFGEEADKLISMEPEDDNFTEEEDGSSDDDSSPERPPSDSEEDEEYPENTGDPGLDPGEINAEMQIEGDFDRLINNIRANEGTSHGLLAKDWDFADDQDTQFKDDLRLASGIGLKRRKGGRTVGPSLSFEVRSLLGDGNQAYVDGNLTEAVRIMLEVIRIEPRAASAWSVLAQCHDDMKQDQQALQLRIMAAHLRHDADEWDRLARQSKDLGYNAQALYCWRKQSSLDPSNVNAQWDRASLAREMGDLKTTRNAFLAILKRFPHDLAVLSELRTLLIEMSDLTTCITLFQAAFEHYQKKHPSGNGHDPTTNRNVPGGGFGHMEILVLADLYNITGEHQRAVDVIRQGCRWLQGRVEHRHWDTCDDDREYDQADAKRNTESGPQPGMFPLDVNARHRLAIARIKMGEFEEAKLHASIVLSEDILDYAPLFVEIADAYFEKEMYAEARPIYELLGSEASTSSLEILMQTAACLRMLDELREAVDVYECIRLLDQTNNDVKMKLAEIYEILNEPRKALELVYEVIDSRQRAPKGPDTNSSQPSQQPSASLFAEDKSGRSKASASRAANRMSAEALKELEAKLERDTLKSHRRLTELWPMISKNEVNDSEREWLIEAEKLIEGFRETRKLFGSSAIFRGMFPVIRRASKDSQADEDRMASRLHLELENDGLPGKSGTSTDSTDIFRGLHFRDWLDIFFQYCFLNTRRGRFESADEILRHILLSVAYRSRQFQSSIRLAMITCALEAQNFTSIVDSSRKLMMLHQFNNEPLRIFMAAMSSGLRSTDAFIVSPLQKAIYREVKLSRIAAETPEMVKWIASQKRFTLPLPKAGEQEEANDDQDAGGPDEAAFKDLTSANDAHPLPEITRRPNPVLAALYGQMCVAARSYQSAIFYLLYAYDLCPDDPMICLSIAMASIGRAMQRQADNRHHLITQAMGFLTRYRHLRGEQADGIGEVEFNFGRAFHQLGLYSHAVTHYEKVLDLAQEHQSKYTSLAQEAAYNLSLIYAMTGAAHLARLLYRRWLSF
ncbi:hypothetical protein C8J57DRAFT_1377318 [Mycena rebaudengoi]|nr:hypothetical protein C8J57DRAFT_1377318 [Mycena rebaudengoi]